MENCPCLIKHHAMKSVYVPPEERASVSIK
jgi:hypothetical protein